jgi:hypothetical protein
MRNKTLAKIAYKLWSAKNKDAKRKISQRFGQTLKGRFANLKKAAKSRGIPNSLTIAEYESLIFNKPCFYCDGQLPLYGYGVDRKNSAVGYEPSNIVPCCKRCNSILAEHDKTETFEHLAKMLAKIPRSARAPSTA